MTPLLFPALLTLAVLLAWARLILRQWRVPHVERSRGWRIALLVVAQPLLAGLLYLTLVPPPIGTSRPDSLTVLTRGGSAVGGPAVALPEASPRPGIERAPDLATALRRHPGIRRLHISGEGLEARDRPAAKGLALAFTAVPLPPGLVELTPPGRVAPGGILSVSGRIEDGGTVELLDPAGARVAATAPDGEGRFTLEGAARLPGLALFHLRTRDARGAIVSNTEIPVWTAAEPGLHVMLLGGAPGPEVKFWRRWASDAGLVSAVRVALGAGLDLGDPSPPLAGATLSKLDLLILDERSWAGLSGAERAAIAAAVRGGMGLLLKVTGPVPAGYGAAVGLPVSGGAATAPVRLLGTDGKALPLLTRRLARSSVGDTLPLLGDASGATLANWRAVGRGRVGLWLLTDAAGLVTSGHGDRYGELWARTVATLARPQRTPPPRLDPFAARGQRMTLCGLDRGDQIVRPDGGVDTPLLDAGAPGCAGYWPRESGWHGLRHGDATWPFYVRSAPIAGIAAAERRDATLAMVGEAADPPAASPGASGPGPSWPWLIAFLVMAALLWWLERGKAGRAHGSAIA
ncbi:carboxypeptidase regulatory-like domain-containing protein [uncultured Sphingomonas sp.]|uniref:carboxypeptidase regulatory-like domain-containing protein n=1 Tax=uncultured Sphingomonas sp. TaxID=158754 RepID=UPI0025CE1CA6|nr:carboxypeptidase regulatory-like domain-containing protein [uncultured Sphingomonas sp.]